MSYDYLRSAPIRRLHHPIEENPIWKILGSAITSVVAVIIGLPFLLVFCFVLPACLSVRWLLLLIYWNRRGLHSGSGPESVGGNDRRWLGAAWNSSVIHAVLIFESSERLNVDKFRQLLLARVIPLYPRLTRRPVSLPLSAGIGHCWLKDSKFSIDRHVFPGPSLRSEKDLQNYISELLKDGLPQDKPPWEFQIVQKFGEGQDTAVILRVHQSVADGTALLSVLCQSLADSQDIEIPHGPSFGSLSFCINIFRACITGPLNLLFWVFFSTEDCNILTRKSSWTGSLTVTWSASITLPKVIRIKQVTRSTVNCVLISALAGAIHRFLQGCGIKHPADIKAVVPMDLRSSSDSRRISSRLGNRSFPMFVSLPVAVEGCVPRLWATRKILSSLRNSTDPVILYVATTALMSIGPASIARDLINSIMDKASLQFSSLPGPASEIYVGGQTLKAIYPLLPAQTKLGISITAITYADQVFVSVIAERALAPAAELILEYFEDQIEVLWNLLLHRRVPGDTRNSTTFTHFDASESTSEDIASRLQYVQQEVQRLSESSGREEEENLYNLRAEFSELMSELKRRHSAEVDERFHLPCSTMKRPMNTLAQRKDHSPGDEEKEEIKEDERGDLTGSNPERKETVYSVTDEVANPEAVYSKVRIKRSKNSLDDRIEINMESRKESFSGYVPVHGKYNSNNNNNNINNNNNNHKEQHLKGKKTDALSELTEGNIKQGKYRSKSAREEKRGISRDFGKVSNEGEMDRNRCDERDGDNRPRRKTSDAQELETSGSGADSDDQIAYLGPINTDLKDLYCSNYLQHKLEMLQKEKSRLDREILVARCGNQGEVDDGEIAGGVLI